jgi:proline iminopeptidase
MKLKLTGVLMISFAAAILLTACEKENYVNDEGNLVPKTVELDPSLPSITVNGAKLHAEAFGPADSALLIVIHGGPGTDYRSLLKCKEFTKQNYRVVFYDQRGTGLSQRFPKSVYNLQLAYDDLAGVIAHYKTSPNQKVFLLGHSWGAMLATAYINKYPTAVNGAILAEPGGFKWNDVEDYITRLQKLNLFSEHLNDVVYIDQFLTGKKDEHAILDYKFLLSSEAETGTIGNEDRIPSWRYGAVTSKAYLEIGKKEKPDWTTNLKSFTTKVLFIYSERNKAYGVDHAVKVSAAYPNVQLFKALGAGHDMFSFTTGFNNSYPVMLTYLNALK